MIFVTLLDAEREIQMKAILWKLMDKKGEELNIQEWYKHNASVSWNKRTHSNSQDDKTSQQGRKLLNSKHCFQIPFAAPPRKELSAILPSKNLTVTAGRGFMAQEDTKLWPRQKRSQDWNHRKALVFLWQPLCNTARTGDLHFCSLQTLMLNQAVIISLGRWCAVRKDPSNGLQKGTRTNARTKSSWQPSPFFGSPFPAPLITLELLVLFNSKTKCWAYPSP